MNLMKLTNELYIKIFGENFFYKKMEIQLKYSIFILHFFTY